MNMNYAQSTDELSNTAFYDKFKKDYLPSYDFFELFFATLFLKDFTTLKSKKIKKIIYDAKKKNLHKDLLKDINVSYNGLEYISEDITKNLNILQTLGIVGRTNPSYETIINYYGEAKAKEKIEQFNSYGIEMDDFTKDFINSMKD